MYRLVEPQELRDNWQFVKHGLERILLKSPEYWIPEDIYASLANNKSTLWLWIENDKPVGFVVGYVVGENFHIWCAHGILHSVKQAFAELEDIVRGKCKRITFESWRSGWTKTAKQLGFSPRGWVKEI